MRDDMSPPRALSIRSVALVSFAVGLATLAPACSGDDGEPGASAGGAAATGGAAGSASGGAAGGGGTGGAAGSGGAAGASGGAAGSAGAAATCADLSAPTCFSNYDCPNVSDRCENLGTELSTDVCCVPGARGTKVAGEACAKDIDCKSTICIDQLCSDTCKTIANCPSNMKVCKPIAFSGSSDFWCFPNP